MNKRMIAALKSKIKERSPELTKAGIVIVTTATTLAVKHLFDSRHKVPNIHNDDLEWVRQENTTITYSIDGHDYSLGYIGITPNF